MAGKNALEVGPESASIASVVRSLRAGADWTQAELAERAELSRWLVVQIEGGKYPVTAFQVAQIARAFGLRASEFLAKAGL